MLLPAFTRPITSYAKFRACASRMLRNRAFQLRRPRVRQLRYLNVGCGWNTDPRFINVDALWHSGIDVCWDISRGLPFASASMRGLFTEHCLEHFSMPGVVRFLAECRRVLAPGCTLRVVVPDAELYLRAYCALPDGGGPRFPYPNDALFEGIHAPLLAVNRVFYQDRESPTGHRCMFDYALLEALLLRCGFDAVRRCAFRDGADATLLIDTRSRAQESLYVEACAAQAADAGKSC